MMVNERKTEAVAFAFIAWRSPYQFYPMLRMQGLQEVYERKGGGGSTYGA
jgi:hypothetical protein